MGAAVWAELAGLPEEPPTTEAIALVLARDLDCAAFAAHHARLARELEVLIRTCRDVPRVRLSAVTNMAQR